MNHNTIPSMARGAAVLMFIGMVGVSAATAQVPTLSLNADDVCYQPDDIITVTVDMSLSGTPICGAQFFLLYDQTRLAFIGIVPSGVLPFTFELFEMADPKTGFISYAVVPFPGQGCGDGTMGPALVATITFQAIETCIATLEFRPNDPPTILVDPDGVAIKPILVDMEPIKINNDVPPIVGCPDDFIVCADPETKIGIAIWDEIITTGGCGEPLDETCDAHSGDPFPVGLHTVTCQAVDQCGLVGECSFNIDSLVDVDPPEIVHSTGQIGETRPFTGYVDPRAESSDGKNLDRGLGEITLVFVEPVFAPDGGPLTPDDFVVTTTGGDPPVIGEVDSSQSPIITLTFDFAQGPPPPIMEWTTIRAVVRDFCGNVIIDDGDQGPAAVELDRLDFLFLPADVDQDSEVTPFDLLKFRQIVQETNVPEMGIPEDYVDIDRDGNVSPFDLLTFRRLIQGVPPATQPWVSQAANHPQP